MKRLIFLAILACLLGAVCLLADVKISGNATLGGNVVVGPIASISSCGAPNYNCSTHSTAAATLPTRPDVSGGVNTIFHEYSAPTDFYYPTSGAGNCMTRLTDASSNGNKSFRSTWGGGGNDNMWGLDRTYSAVVNSGGGVQAIHVHYDSNGCMVLDNTTLSALIASTSGGFVFGRTTNNIYYKVDFSTGTKTTLVQGTLSGTTTVTTSQTTIFDFNHCPGVDGTTTSTGGNGALSISSDDNIFFTNLNLSTTTGQGNAHWLLVWNRSTGQCASRFTGTNGGAENPAAGNIWAFCGPGDCSQHGSNPAPIANYTGCTTPGGIHGSQGFHNGLYYVNSGGCEDAVNYHQFWEIGTANVQAAADPTYQLGGHGTAGYSRFYAQQGDMNSRPVSDITNYIDFANIGTNDFHGSEEWAGSAADTNPWMVSTTLDTTASCTAAYCYELAAVRQDGVIARFANNFHTFTTDSGELGPVPNVTSDGYCQVFNSNWNQTLGTDSDGHSRNDLFAVCNLQ